MKRHEFLIALGLLLLGTLFALYLVAPYFRPGLNVGGDDTIHVSYNQELADIVRETGKFFGWSYLYGTGAPIFIFRPPGYYLTVVILHFLSGGLIGLVLAHKIVTAAVLVLYPLAVFYFFSKLDFPPVIAGVTSLLALAPISTWGHTIDAYFDLGLSKQAVALLLVPFALGKLHGIMRKGEAIFPGALLFALVFLNHPYMAWSLVLVLGAYLVCHLASFPLAETARGAARAAGVLCLGGLFLAFWLMPFYSSGEVHPTRPYGAGWRHGFTVIGETAGETAEHFVRGSLFDQARGRVFGQGSVWSWRDNSGLGRWPALSWAAIIGLIALAPGFRRFNRLFLLFGFLFSFIVFLGPDDVPALGLIPFQEQFQYIHWAPILELFAIGAAAFGIHALSRLLYRAIERLRAMSRKPLSGSAQSLVYYPVLLVITLVFVFPIWRERSRWAEKKVKTRTFDLKGREQSAHSLRFAVNSDYQEVIELLSRSDPNQRFYASPTQAQSGLEIFFFTLTPAITRRTNVISPLFAGMKGGWNNVVGSTFRRDLWKSRPLLELLNVHYIVSSQNNRPNFTIADGFMKEGVSNRSWFVYRVEGDFSNFGFTSSRPILLLADYPRWEEVNRHWPRYYQELARPEEAVFLVKSFQRALSRLSDEELARYQAIVLADWEWGEKETGLARLKRFAENGGRIYALEKVEGLDSAKRLDGIGDLAFLRESRGRETPWSLVSTREKREHHSAEVECKEPGFLYLKHAFYRGWRAFINGERVENHCLSPGYNSVELPAGRHRVEFVYAGANKALWGNLVSGLSLVLALAWFLQRKIRGRPGRRAESAVSSGEQGP